ncbi:MAG: AtpZ/AtpI family protein [Candidatus Paracaedibacteraceae bacterium]|nr:AtpZ/AtpI family protein [Candidatus Paracaedibacteraceae bacterium]
MTNNTPKPKNAIAGLALRAGTEFISGIIMGVIFGLAIDHFFPTKPFGLIIMILLGAAAGLRNIFRLVGRDFSAVESNSPKEKTSDRQEKL